MNPVTFACAKRFHGAQRLYATKINDRPLFGDGEGQSERP